MKRLFEHKVICLIFGMVFVLAFGQKACAQIGSEWIKCSDRTVAADKTQFSGHGVNVYKGKTDHLLIVVDQGSNSARFCLQIMGGWKFVGFKEYPKGQASKALVVVFQISTDALDRYFDIKTGNEVFLDRDEDGKQFISSSAKSREQIFSR